MRPSLTDKSRNVCVPEYASQQFQLHHTPISRWSDAEPASDINNIIIPAFTIHPELSTGLPPEEEEYLTIREYWTYPSDIDWK